MSPLATLLCHGSTPSLSQVFHYRHVTHSPNHPFLHLPHYLPLLYLHHGITALLSSSTISLRPPLASTFNIPLLPTVVQCSQLCIIAAPLFPPWCDYLPILPPLYCSFNPSPLYSSPIIHYFQHFVRHNPRVSRSYILTGNFPQR